jgi:hypothetical protein
MLAALNIKPHIATKSALICHLQFPHNQPLSVPHNSQSTQHLFPLITPIDLFLLCKLNGHTALKYRPERVVSSHIRRSGRIAERSSPFSAYVKNVWSYIPTPPHTFLRCPQARPLLFLCLTTYKTFKNSNIFTSSYHVSK